MPELSTAPDSREGVLRRSYVVPAGVVIGVALEVIGKLWDDSWHAHHGDLGSVAALFQAHFLIFAGAALVLAAAVAWVRRRPSRGLPVMVLLAGAVAQVVGLVWDSIRHVQGEEAPPAHVLIFGGLAVGVVGLVWAVVSSGFPARGASASSPAGR
ncbi:MAG: hypothetical protein HOY79_00130 [Streptomyces sp.]|nr:hypothetical protein [Streptomyces sp.]